MLGVVHSKVDVGLVGKRLTELARGSLSEGYQTAIIEAMAEIDRVLKERGITRKALAERLGVHPSYITRMLNDPDNITVRTLYRLCNALDLRASIHVGPRPQAVGDVGEGERGGSHPERPELVASE